MCSMTVHGSCVFCHIIIPERFLSPFNGILVRSFLLSFVDALVRATFHCCHITLGFGNGCRRWCLVMYGLSIIAVEGLSL